MPTCKSCQGEYIRQDCVCPACSEKLGRSLNLCHHCGAVVAYRRLCPRCKSDVSAWEKESFPLDSFVIGKGLAGLGPTLVAVIFWIFVWGPGESSIHHPIGSITAIMLSLLIFGTLYTLRYELREGTWASQIYHMARPSLSVIGAGSFLIGLASTLIAIILYKASEPTTQIPFSEKLIFALVYGLAYVGFTAAFTLIGLGSYLAQLDERVPQPVFVHTDRLLEIVLQTAARSLRGRKKATEDSETYRNFEIIEIHRDRSDGGIQVLVKDSKALQQPTDSNFGGIWSIDADRWGRIRSLKPGTLPER